MRLLVQAFQADGLEVACHPRHESRRGDRVVVNDLADGVDWRLAHEGRTAGEHLVEDRTQGVDVGRRPDVLRLPARLLGGHVAGRAHDLTGRGLLAVRFQPFGQTEVGDLGHAVGGEEDVAWLEIAMDDPGLMGGVDGSSQRGHQFGPRSSRLGRARKSIVETAAFEQLERHERQAVYFADIINLQDVRMP